MRKLTSLLLVALVISSLAGQARAQDSGGHPPQSSVESANAGSIDGILITSPDVEERPRVEAGIEGVAANEELKVVYDPADYPLSPDETDVFNSKKSKFLERFRKVLSTFRLKQSWIDKASDEIEKKFDARQSLIARSNTFGGAVSITVNGGLALPAVLLAKLKQRPIGKWLPKSGGFYYIFGAGVGFARQVEPSGRNNFALELFVDFERLKSTMTGIVEAGFAGSYGVVYEMRDKDMAVNRADVTYGGLAGSFRSGERQFGWSATSGVSFPPFIGSVLVYTTEVERIYLLRVSRDGISVPFLKGFKDWIVGLRDRARARMGGARCEAAFR